MLTVNAMFTIKLTKATLEFKGLSIFFHIPACTFYVDIFLDVCLIMMTFAEDSVINAIIT